MDPTQEELDILGFLGMCAKSIKIISSCKKIFLQITLTLILPLSIIFFSHSGISILLTTKIMLELHERSRFYAGNSAYEEVFDVLSIEYVEYWVTEVAYSTFLFAFSLLSTSTVVYTVSCVYSYKKTTYKRVMSFAFKVWNMLMITLICNLGILIAHNTLTILTLVLVATQFQWSDMKSTRVILSTIYVLYFVGFIYISVIWQISSVVSVLEESYGFQAIVKSKALIKGKMGISAAIFLEVNLCLGCIHLLFDKFVVFEESFGVVGKVGFGGLFLVLRSLVFLFGLVAQTVVYFACKSCVNNSSMANYFDIYIRNYAPLESIVVETEQGYIVTLEDVDGY